MLRLVGNESKFHGEIERLGLTEMLNQFSLMQKIFNQKQHTGDSSILKCRHFMHFLSELVNKIRAINFNNFYELLEEENKRKNNEPFWVDFKESDLCGTLAQ